MLNYTTPDKPTTEAAAVPLLLFQVGQQAYGVFVSQVIRIIEMVLIVQVKQVRDFIPGLINFQGHALPVVDMRLRLGFPPQPYGLHTPIVLVSLAATGEAQSDVDKMLGLIVDEVEQVIEVAVDSFEYNTPQRLAQLTDLPSDHQASYLHGLAHIDHRMVMVLNLAELLHPTDYQVLQSTSLTPPLSHKARE